jgi:ATP-binding cassette subfamily B protein
VTLRRFGGYFKPYWSHLVLAVVLLIGSTWAQVTAPKLIGQLVDCYLTPAAVTAVGNLPLATEGGIASGAVNNCTMESDPAVLSSAERLAGLGRVALMIVGLYLMTAALTGLTVYLMNWSGQHVLRQMRVELFKHLHRLSLGYYSEQEAGNLMSRITNDTDTIQQVFNFGLIGVLSGALLIVWIGYSMFQVSVMYALISLSVVPIMILITMWFSSQARKAFRQTRLEMGSVNAELQESISSVREVQAFSREQENIDNFMITNAANRDANIRAVSYTSALAPTLEALGYLALAIVAGVGGILLLRGQALFGTVLSLGLVITFLNYVQSFNRPIQQISVMWTNIQSAIAGGERIFNLLDEKPAIEDLPDAQEMPTIRGQVELQKVFAAYKEEESVLNGISFKAEPGSQGQRQLISIARAALSDPQILILDEATSSVDTRTERLIQKALESLLKGRTSFVIAHRLSTIRNADLLLVLDKGQIVERGKHEELLAKKGSYYDLYMSQFRRVEPVEEPGTNGREMKEVAAAQD